MALFADDRRLHIKRFYCDLLRTTVLFWPASYKKLVVVFDQESSQDHKLGKILLGHFLRFYPERKLKIAYEALKVTISLLAN